MMSKKNFGGSSKLVVPCPDCFALCVFSHCTKRVRATFLCIFHMCSMLHSGCSVKQTQHVAWREKGVIILASDTDRECAHKFVFYRVFYFVCFTTRSHFRKKNGFPQGPLDQITTRRQKLTKKATHHFQTNFILP